MKKYVLLILIGFFLIPSIVFAEKTNVRIGGVTKVKTGENVLVSFNAKFKEVSYPTERDGTETETTGVYMFAVEFGFDESVLEITSVSSEFDIFDVGITKYNNKYYAVGILNGNVTPNYCPNGVSICTEATIKVFFNIKDTDKTSTEIKVTELEGVLITYDGKSEFSENNTKVVEEKVNVIHTFQISKGETTTKQETKPAIVVEEKKEVDIKSEAKKETKTIKKKATENKNKTNTTTNDKKEEENVNTDYNFYLKKLEIEGYEIGFNKHQAIYEITVAKDVNSLKINAEVESSKSKLEIKGADNLEESHDKVNIIVTSGKGETKTYVININRKEEEKHEKEGFSLNITEDQKKMAIFFVGGVLGLGLIIFIIIKIRDKKIEKNIDKW